MNPPNIIFIVLDTFRADKLFSSFKGKKLTPFMETLRKNSHYFKNCIANSPWTIPSHINMFTSLYDMENSYLSGHPLKITESVPVLTEILFDLGYETFSFIENPAINETSGFLRGFKYIFRSWKDPGYWINKSDEVKKATKFLNILNVYINQYIQNEYFLKIWNYFNKFLEISFSRFIKKILWKRILFKNNTIEDLEKFENFLKEKIDQNKPNYIFFNIMATHIPYIPNKKSIKYLNLTLKEFKKVKDFLLFYRKYIININLNLEKFGIYKQKIIEKFYNSCVYYSDLIVKKIFSLIKEWDLLENSYVIITSDHGEHLGGKLDHYYWEHNTYVSVLEPIIKVPLLIFNKNYVENEIKNQVQLKDLFHTILNLACTEPKQIRSLKISKSIINQISPNSYPRLIFGEYRKPKYRIENLFNLSKSYFEERNIDISLIPKIINNIQYLRSNQYKLISYHEDLNEFYEISVDKNELENKYDKKEKICLKMQNLVKEKINKIKIKSFKLKEKTRKNREKVLIDKSIEKLKFK